MTTHIKSIKLVSLIKSCLCIALLSMTFGATAAYADYIPLPPNVPVGTTVVLVPGHYSHHRGHRVFVPTHYVAYMGPCGCAHRVWIARHRHHGHMIKGHYSHYKYGCCVHSCNYYYYKKYYR